MPLDLVVTRPLDDGGEPKLIVKPSKRDLELYAKVTPGKIGLARIFYPRNLKHLRWYWGLLHIVCDGLGIDNVEAFHLVLKKRLNLVEDVFMLPDGEVHVKYESVAIHGGMDEARFNWYCRAVEREIFEHYLPGARKSVREQVEQYVGFACPWGQ